MQNYFSVNDFRAYLKRNKNIFICLLCCVFVGILVGVFIVVSSDSYLSILTSSSHVFFDYVNGRASLSGQVSKLIGNNLMFELVVFLLCLNYYSGLLSYAFVAFQSTLLFFSLSATISEFGFSGLLLAVLIELPTNIILFACNLMFCLVCLSRSFETARFKNFKMGFDRKSYWLSICALVLFSIAFSCLVILLFMLVLKSRIFMIF